MKYEEDPIKNEGARGLTRFYDVFSDAQGQLTPKSLKPENIVLLMLNIARFLYRSG